MGVCIIFTKTIVTLFKEIRKYFVPQWVFSNDFATLYCRSLGCCCVMTPPRPPSLVASNRSHLLLHDESVDMLGSPAHLNRFSWFCLGLLMLLQWVDGSAGGWSQLGWPGRPSLPQAVPGCFSWQRKVSTRGGESTKLLEAYTQKSHFHRILCIWVKSAAQI